MDTLDKNSIDREQASLNEALLRTDTEITEPLSDKQPEEGQEKDKPDIHVAITKIQDSLGIMTKLFERLMEDKADKPLQGDRPTGSQKEPSAGLEDSSDEESDSETTAFRLRGKRKRREKSLEAIAIHVDDTEDEVAKQLGTDKEGENVPETEAQWMNLRKACQMSNGRMGVYALFLDFRKAFDLVGHGILLRKLAELRINTSFWLWLQSFLDGRTQQVKLNSFISSIIMPCWCSRKVRTFTDALQCTYQRYRRFYS